MFKLFNKNNNKPDFVLSSIAEQCIPYACHYDDSTLLTKNGELMQVIKIEGYSKEMSGFQEDADLRNIIRQAILEHVQDKKIALWFHTIRRKRNLDSMNYFAWTFAKDTHQSWAEKNYWREKFINELYITVLYEGEPYDHMSKFFLSFAPKALKEDYLLKMNDNHKKLDLVVSNILNNIKAFGGQKLGVINDHLGFRSEILEFLSKIVSLKGKRVALPIQSIDSIFCRSRVAFGGNVLEIISEQDKRFAAVFTIKEYHDFAAKALDKFLRIASEYVISQTLNFVDSEQAKKSFEQLDYILSVSKDDNLKEYSGLAATLSSDKNGQTDYASQQMSIMIIGESLEELQRSVSSVVRELNKLGIVIVREDLHLALCFWSQLPGNFKFFRRPSFINTRRSASFASLHNTPSGATENIWGNAVTIFRRDNGAPHFFNFHVEGNGHCIAAGPPDIIRQNFVHFLISESSKYDPTVLYIDQFNNSQVILMLLGGRYEYITLSKTSLSLNPLSMKDSQENHGFIKNWLLLLAFPFGKVYSLEQKEKIFTAFDIFVSKIEVKNRNISKLLEFIEDDGIKNSLSLYCKGNKFGALFDNEYDEFGAGSKILGVNVTDLQREENLPCLTPFIAYIMYKYSAMLEKLPSICVINDANILLEDNFFAQYLPQWLDKLTQNNAVAILLYNSKNKITSNIASNNQKIATYFLFPTLDPNFYKEQFNLNNEEVSQVKNLKTMYRNVMIKQGKHSIVVELNLDGMDYVIKALSGRQDAIDAMNKAIETTGDNPNRWIVPFYKNLFPNR
jgi:type IV secretion system protein VirB4